MGNTINFFDEKRGWSVIKDNIIAAYLTPYISKILHTGKPLTIIDCFAGKGKFEDGSLGSPLIIAERIKDVLSKDSRNKIDALFIEKKYHKELKSNIKCYNNCEVLEGTFEDNTSKILELSKDRNLFVYVDPYGIKSLDFKRFKKIKDNGFYTLEMLINFNSFGFLREGCRLLKLNNEFTRDEDIEKYEVDSKNSISKMKKIAGGDYWIDILNDYELNIIDMYKAEELFVKQYLGQFNTLFNHVLNIPIKSKVRNIPKYRLIFGTNHDDGLIIMADNMYKRWQEIINNERKGQMSIFDAIEERIDRNFINIYDYPNYERQKGYNPQKDILDILKRNNDYIFLKDLIVKMIKRYGISFPKKKYIDIIRALEIQNKLEVSRYPSKTGKRGKPSKSYDYKKRTIKVRLV